MRHVSLSTKLILLVGVLVTAIVVTAATLVGGTIFVQIEREIERQLSTETASIVTNYLQVSKGAIQLSPAVSGEALATELRTLDLSLYIENTEGAALAKYGIYRDLSSSQQAIFTPTSLLTRATSGGGIYQDVSLGSTRYDTYTIPLRSKDVFAGYLQIARTNNVLPLITQTLSSTFLLVLPLIWLVALFATSSLVKAILLPLSRLVTLMEVADVETLTTHTFVAPLASDREVAVLTRAYNSLLSRVRITISREREVAENISHEFRTPLTRIASSLAVTAQTAPPTVSKSLRKSIKEIVALGATADTILALALSHDVVSAPTTCLLSPLLSELSGSIPSKITWQSDVPKDFRVPMPPEHARVLWQNLLDNAVKYNHDQGKITVHARTSGEEWKVEMTNTTSTPSTIPGKVFERWWRGSQPTKIRGSGIGMAIIHDICRKHHLTAAFFVRDGVASATITGKIETGEKM